MMALKPAYDPIPQAQEIDLRPFEQRWALMRLEAMSKWYQRWRDISRHINPKRGFFEGFVPNYNAQYDYKLVIDDNPAYYAGVYASGMQSGLTNQSERWFRIGVGNTELEERDDVKTWTEQVEKIIRDIFQRSNIYETYHQTYEELALFGTGSFGIFEDFDSVIRCKSYTIGEYYLAVGPDGRVNAFARQYWMTVAQLVKEYGWKNVSDKVQALYNSGNMDQYVLVYTICEPNESRIKNYDDFKGMPYRSVTWEAQHATSKALKVSGYREFPFMCPRGRRTTTADVYGTGPGFDSLGNIKMLYRMQKDSLLAINKVADPPVVVDASVEGNANMLPGGVTRSSSTVKDAGVRPAYQVQPDIEAIEMKIDKTDRKIAARFFVDLFKMMIDRPDDPKRTAREIAEKHEEKLFLLGPVLGSVQGDMLDPSIDRTFMIALRAGLIPPPPRAIQGMNLKVEYISVLALAQKMAGVAAIEQEASFVGTISAVFPDAKDVFNADEAIRAHAGMIGVDSKVIRAKDQVDELRQQRAQIQKQQQDAQNAMAAVQGAGVLAKSRVGKGNALEQMLGVEPAPEAGGTA